MLSLLFSVGRSRMALALGVLGGCSPEAAPGLQATEGWGTAAHHGRLSSGALRCFPRGPLQRLLTHGSWLPPREMEVAHMAYYGLLWPRVWLTHCHFSFFLLEVSHWVQPTVNQREAIQGHEHQKVTLESGYCCPFHDTNLFSYLVTQEILKICLNYFHRRNFSSPSGHLQQSHSGTCPSPNPVQWRVLFKTLLPPPHLLVVSPKSALGRNKIVQLNYMKIMCWFKSSFHWVHVLVTGKSISSFNWPREECDKEKRHSRTWHSLSQTWSLFEGVWRICHFTNHKKN